MKHSVPHSLDTETARKVARQAAQGYAERFAKYSPEVRWETEDRAVIGFSAKGISLKGSLELEPGAIVFDLDVPFLLRPFAGKAVRVIEREVQREVAKAQGQ